MCIPSTCFQLTNKVINKQKLSFFKIYMITIAQWGWLVLNVAPTKDIMALKFDTHQGEKKSNNMTIYS